MQPPHVVLVHGEANEMGRLKKVGWALEEPWNGWWVGRCCTACHWLDAMQVAGAGASQHGLASCGWQLHRWSLLVLLSLTPYHHRRLAVLQALEQHAAALGIPRTLYMPKVTQSVLIEHKAERTAKVVGRLGEKAARLGQPVRGLLVQGRGGARSLMHHEDLPRFTKLHPGRVVQRQVLALHRPFSEVRE